MKSNLTAGMNPERKEELQASFRAGVLFRERLKEVLEGKMNARRNAISSTDQYSSPSWALLQADHIGYERALNEVISLIFENKVEK